LVYWQFGRLLLKLSEIFGDKKINYLTIEPDAVAYYHRHCSFFGLASFEPLRVLERYRPVMARDGDVDSFVARGGDMGAFWGSSLKWAIVCDRISWELAVLALDADIDIPAEAEIKSASGAWIPGYMRSQYHWKLEVAEDFNRRFFANYPIQ